MEAGGGDVSKAGNCGGRNLEGRCPAFADLDGIECDDEGHHIVEHVEAVRHQCKRAHGVTL